MISAARHKFIAVGLKNDDVIVYVCMSVCKDRGFCGKLKDRFSDWNGYSPQACLDGYSVSSRVISHLYHSL